MPGIEHTRSRSRDRELAAPHLPQPPPRAYEPASPYGANPYEASPYAHGEPNAFEPARVPQERTWPRHENDLPAPATARRPRKRGPVSSCCTITAAGLGVLACFGVFGGLGYWLTRPG